jgi:hypothetical protein
MLQLYQARGRRALPAQLLAPDLAYTVRKTTVLLALLALLGAQAMGANRKLTWKVALERRTLTSLAMLRAIIPKGQLLSRRQ